MAQRHSLQRGQYVPEFIQCLCQLIGHCLGPEKPPLWRIAFSRVQTDLLPHAQSCREKLAHVGLTFKRTPHTQDRKTTYGLCRNIRPNLNTSD
jgi:hypothetical protein